jgi:hypothetical protein
MHFLNFTFDFVWSVCIGCFIQVFVQLGSLPVRSTTNICTRDSSSSLHPLTCARDSWAGRVSSTFCVPALFPFGNLRTCPPNPNPNPARTQPATQSPHKLTQNTTEPYEGNTYLSGLVTHTNLYNWVSHTKRRN